MGSPAVAPIFDRAGDSNTTGSESCDGFVDVLAAKRYLVTGFLTGMATDLPEGRSKDQPAFPRIEILQAELVPKKKAQLFGLGRIEHGVNTGYHADIVRGN